MFHGHYNGDYGLLYCVKEVKYHVKVSISIVQQSRKLDLAKVVIGRITSVIVSINTFPCMLLYSVTVI